MSGSMEREEISTYITGSQLQTLEKLLRNESPSMSEIEATNKHRETTLHLVSKYGCTSLASMLLEHHANIEARSKNGMTPLHSAASSLTPNISTIQTLLRHNADITAKDNEERTPLDHLRQNSNNSEIKLLLKYHSKRHANTSFETTSKKMEELESEMSQIIGMEKLKEQIRTWAKGIILNKKRRKLGFNITPTKTPHMLFLGNPGTGKTTMARILGKLLHKFGVLPSEKFIEVQRTDLVAQYIGQTGPKTRVKINEAKGGILFVDEAYRLMPYKTESWDFGKEALEEIMSIMESGEVVVIFAGYEKPMKSVLGANEGIQRRVRTVFHFDDYSVKDLAEMLHLKMNGKTENGALAGFKLHGSCTVEAMAELLMRKTNEKQRKQLNGGLVSLLLTSAQENLDHRLSLESCVEEDICTITLEDLEAGIKSLPTGNLDC